MSVRGGFIRFWRFCFALARFLRKSGCVLLGWFMTIVYLIILTILGLHVILDYHPFPDPPWYGPDPILDYLDKDFDFVQDFVLDPDPGGDVDEVIILRWTEYFGSPLHGSPLVMEKGEECPFFFKSPRLTHDCRLTYDRRHLNISHAVVFHVWDLDADDYLQLEEELPEDRPPGQVWIYHNNRPPALPGKLDNRNISKFFNWTMTYRRDSDIYEPFGVVVPLHYKPEHSFYYNPDDMRKLVARKPYWRPVAVILSDCTTPTKREDYVEEMRKFIPIDIYGKCGDKYCQMAYGGDLCYEQLALRYKFLLTFETADCEDYVSETFFGALANDIVPVVYGGANYSLIAPPNSYINAMDFGGAADLASYLRYLNMRTNEYLRYFEWKGRYKVERGGISWCALCEKVLGTINVRRPNLTTKFYEDVDEWWNFKTMPGGGRVPVCDNSTMDHRGYFFPPRQFDNYYNYYG